MVPFSILFTMAEVVTISGTGVTVGVLSGITVVCSVGTGEPVAGVSKVGFEVLTGVAVGVSAGALVAVAIGVMLEAVAAIGVLLGVAVTLVVSIDKTGVEAVGSTDAVAAIV